MIDGDAVTLSFRRRRTVTRTRSRARTRQKTSTRDSPSPSARARSDDADDDDEDDRDDPRPRARERVTRGRAIDRRARASLDDGTVTTSDGATTVDRRSFLGFALATASAVVAPTTAVPGRADGVAATERRGRRGALGQGEANRQQRIQSETAKGKKHVNDTGLKLDADGTAMQTAVYKLSKAGARVRAGALDEAADGLNGD